MRRLLILIGFLALASTVVYVASGTPSNLVVRTDANNYLLVTSVTQTNPVTQGVFSSRTLRTDSSGSLQVILTGTVTPTYPMSIPASTCAAPSLGEAGAVTTGIAFTATPSILNCITGTAVTTLTATTLTQTVSNLITRGAITTQLQVRDDTVTWNNAGVTFTGWKLNVTDTASNAASLLMDLQVAGASKFSVRKDGRIVAAQDIQAVGSVEASSGSVGSASLSSAGYVGWNSLSLFRSLTNGLIKATNNAVTIGIELNVGTAGSTVTTCGTGTITANSRNMAGGFTATGATACTVTFGTPAWTNTPFCVVTLRNAPTTTPYISAISTTAFTVSNLTANDVINYNCIGPI